MIENYVRGDIISYEVFPHENFTAVAYGIILNIEKNKVYLYDEDWAGRTIDTNQILGFAKSKDIRKKHWGGSNDYSCPAYRRRHTFKNLVELIEEIKNK